jgi:hypothetical protein
LLDPNLNLACVRAKVGPLEGGDLELEDLAVELAGGHEGELGQGGDACMEDESCKLAAHAGNAGKLGDRVPFLKVTQMDARSAREGFLIGFGSGLAEELEGGGDPEFGQVVAIGLGQTGQVRDFPISGFESHGAWGIKNNLSILGLINDRLINDESGGKGLMFDRLQPPLQHIQNIHHLAIQQRGHS